MSRHGGSPGGATGWFGGIGIEYKDQHVGKVWRFEESVRNGGTGTDPPDEEVGSEDIEKDRIGALMGRRIAG